MTKNRQKLEEFEPLTEGLYYMTTKCIWLFFCGAPGPAVMGQLDLKQKVAGFLVLEVKGCSSELILRMYNEAVNPGRREPQRMEDPNLSISFWYLG